MTLYIKKPSPNGAASSVSAHNCGEAVRMRNEFIAHGYEAWIEDVDGEVVS